ncbi:hypothetical protein PM082_011075 [Marasmius tenuissimus]|nr:hypothetical protein PM082_011075 [Marasmius tenuissimus]
MDSRQDPSERTRKGRRHEHDAFRVLSGWFHHVCMHVYLRVESGSLSRNSYSRFYWRQNIQNIQMWP